MLRRHLGISCIVGVLLGCGPVPERAEDTALVGAETRVAIDAGAGNDVDHDGEVEVESRAPAVAADVAALVVLTSLPLDSDESGVVVITRAGLQKPLARIACPFVSDVRIDEAQSMVTWVERSPSESRGVAHLHTFDVATGIHLRFATDNPSWTTPL